MNILAQSRMSDSRCSFQLSHITIVHNITFLVIMGGICCLYIDIEHAKPAYQAKLLDKYDIIHINVGVSRASGMDNQLLVITGCLAGDVS